MNTYILIFLTKIIENTLGTLRIIVVSNGKKVLGAILNGIIALVWIIATYLVIIDINKDYLKILFFCLGSIIGSYLGSIIEENLALGDVLLSFKIDNNEIKKELIKAKYDIDIINDFIIVKTKRKKTQECVNLIKSFDKNINIIYINTNILS